MPPENRAHFNLPMSQARSSGHPSRHGDLRLTYGLADDFLSGRRRLFPLMGDFGELATQRRSVNSLPCLGTKSAGRFPLCHRPSETLRKGGRDGLASIGDAEARVLFRHGSGRENVGCRNQPFSQLRPGRRSNFTFPIHPREAGHFFVSRQWVEIDRYLRKPPLYPAELRDRDACAWRPRSAAS